MNTFLKKILPILMILIGNTTYGLGVILFVLPTGLITGGTTGLGLFFQHSLGLPLNIFIAVFNIAMFLLGVWVLGKKFAITTIVSTFYYPIAFQAMPSIVGDRVLTPDPMLSTAGLRGLHRWYGYSSSDYEQTLWRSCFCGPLRL